jgi:hypothetical protein
LLVRERVMELISFEEHLANILKKHGMKKKEIAALLNLDAGTVSRRFQRNPGFTRDEIAKIDSELSMDGALVEKAGYRNEVPAFAGYVQEFGRKEFSGLPPAYWSYLLKGPLRDTPNEKPALAADFLGVVANQLEEDYCKTSKRTLRQELKPLVGLARLTQANALQNSLPTAELKIPIDLIDKTLQLYPDEETLVFGAAMMFCESRMHTGQVGDIDKLERLEGKVAKCSAYIASFFYEELARQHILSESSEHDLNVIRSNIQRGKEYCLLDRQLRERTAGLDDILGRAEWLKGKDPHRGAAFLHNAATQLEASPHSLDLLVRAYAYEGVMRLDAGQRQEGESILMKGYRYAKEVGIIYFVDWLQCVPLEYGFDVKKASER